MSSPNRCSFSRQSACARSLAALVATIALLQFGSASGAPGDIFSIPAPVIGSDPPKASDIKDGDAAVSSQTGALTYAYPIQVPPGRNGIAPQLALSYSSQAPIYGGIAAGWSLSIPEIREDTSQGRLRTHSPEVELTQSDPAADDRFVSSMAGGRPLIAVTEPTSAGVYQTYRAQNDGSFTRYERMGVAQPFRWRAYSTDGSTMYFGDAGLTMGCANVSDGFAPLTRAIDAFGNEVAYEWELGIGHECRIARITWGQNASADLPQPFAQVAFTWEGAPECSSVHTGSQVDYRTGAKIVTGASKLMSVTATAFPPGSPASPEHTRVVTLGYSAADESCIAQHSPVRLLASIQESAWGTDSPRVDLPAVTFEYGDGTINLVTPQVLHGTPWGGSDPRPKNLGWGFRRNDDRWPTVEAMMLDLDGDGLLDRVTNASTEATDGQCRARWQRNLGPVAGSPSTHPRFGAEQTLAFLNIVTGSTSDALPRLKWNGTTTQAPPLAGAPAADPAFPHLEDCSLNGQATAFGNSVSASFCHNATSCAAGTTDPGPFCFPGGTECPSGAGAGPGDYRTYLAYRWLDMDADGLVDLVAAVHGNINIYDIVQGNGFFNGAPRPPEPNLFGPWPACPGRMELTRGRRDVVGGLLDGPLATNRPDLAAETCKDVDASCMTGAQICPTGGPCTINWATVSACLARAPTMGCNTLTKSVPSPQEPQSLGAQRSARPTCGAKACIRGSSIRTKGTARSQRRR